MDKKLQNLVTKIEERGFSVVDISTYENPSSLIKVACEKGHEVITSWKFMKSEFFRCAHCHGGTYVFDGASSPPSKKDGTFRVIGIDNATERMGLAIFDDGELVFQTVLKFEGLLEDRLLSIFSVLTQVILTQ